MKLSAKLESVTSKINRREMLQIKDGMKEEVTKQLGIVKEVAAMEVGELEKGRTAELDQEGHSGLNQSVSLE